MEEQRERGSCSLPVKNYRAGWAASKRSPGGVTQAPLPFLIILKEFIEDYEFLVVFFMAIILIWF